jgi:predicted nuclease of predicted toxin-antitoxin system
MKLLFDQNISFRIIEKVSDLFPDSKQVRQIGLENCEDLEIWEFAKKNDLVIVTFDSDFYDLSMLKGIPPKVIWLRTGNTTTESISKILAKNYDLIKDFSENPDYKDLSCLEID